MAVKTDDKYIGKIVRFHPPTLEHEHFGRVIDVSKCETAYYVKVRDKYNGSYRCFWMDAQGVGLQPENYQY